jgi:hypothetical protein
MPGPAKLSHFQAFFFMNERNMLLTITEKPGFQEETGLDGTV